MDKPYFRSLSSPKLEKPVSVVGLPGFGNVGKIAARLLIKFCHANIFAELYSPSFPDFVSVDSGGICHLPRYEFYTSSIGESQFIILTGNVQPSEEDIVAQYEIGDEILDFLDNYKCRYLVTTGGIPTPKSAGEVYVAATSSKLASEVVNIGAKVYGGGKIMESAGLMLGLAKKRGWEGICLLGATTGLKADRGSGFSVFKLLTKMLGIEKTGS